MKLTRIRFAVVGAGGSQVAIMNCGYNFRVFENELT